MFVIRNLIPSDLDSIFELSTLQNLINLPHDKNVLEKRISSSVKSFENPSKDLAKNYYLFGLEDTETNSIIGVSMIHAQHGTEDKPHFYLRVGHENKYSKSISTGFVHGTLKLGLDMDGPTEIGGLILHPDYRGNTEKLGKQLSFARFLYMASSPGSFKKIVHSELMPPFDSNGHSPLWEALGRRFMNMDYDEADKLSRSNKEFILSLFPADNIYQTLLTPKARNAIGKVGKQTLPVKKMLESIGFKYKDEVDPFDGGPHYQCELSKVAPIKDSIKGQIKFRDSDIKNSINYLIIVPNNKYKFLCFQSAGCFENGEIVVAKNDIIEKVYTGSDVIAIPVDY